MRRPNMLAITVAALLFSGSVCRPESFNSDRRHRRGVLPDGGRPCCGPVHGGPGHAGDRGSDRRLGRQPQAGRLGKPYIAFTMADAAQDALQGQDKFKGTKVPLKTLMVLYPNRMHVVSIEGTGINTMADLKGKRVSTGSPGSATEVMAFRVIEAAGLDKDKDMKRERLGVAESVNAIKDRKIDAFFWVGGLPTAAVTDLANTPGTTLKMIDHAEVVPKMNAKYGNLYVEDTIQKSVYKGMTADNKQATVWNILVAHETMGDKTAYDIVKTIFDKREDLIAVHKEASSFKLENQKAAASPVPYHPGAVKYFAEKGITLK